jgi:hypothetical protein
MCKKCGKDKCTCPKEQILIEDGTMAAFGLGNMAEVKKPQ